ncbi:MAG: hypothetical protein J0M12_11835 [Deltaproteobacteria bacterium]|nr:hypothetical protein [Deltaproteobacteria bacterium]
MKRNKARGTLTIVVGLPGSGKSHLIEELTRKATGLVRDDFMAGIEYSPLIWRLPTVTDSAVYPRLISDLRSGKQCVISDIIFCDTLIRLEIENAVRRDVPKVDLRWEFFENNPTACKANARRRARKKSLSKELKLITFLSRKYILPEEATAHKVWVEKTSKKRTTRGKKPARTSTRRKK